MTGEGQDDIEFDGDQLLYVDPVTYQAVQRLPEFAKQWTPDPGLAEDAYVDLGTCHYNIPIAMKRDNNTPDAIGEVETLLFLNLQASELWSPEWNVLL